MSSETAGAGAAPNPGVVVDVPKLDVPNAGALVPPNDKPVDGFENKLVEFAVAPNPLVALLVVVLPNPNPVEGAGVVEDAPKPNPVVAGVADVVPNPSPVEGAVVVAGAAVVPVMEPKLNPPPVAVVDGFVVEPKENPGVVPLVVVDVFAAVLDDPKLNPPGAAGAGVVPKLNGAAVPVVDPPNENAMMKCA
ncbi:unnamed protein product [Aphanomyces euteiches]